MPLDCASDSPCGRARNGRDSNANPDDCDDQAGDDATAADNCTTSGTKPVDERFLHARMIGPPRRAARPGVVVALHSRRCAENQRLYRPRQFGRHRTMVRFRVIATNRRAARPGVVVALHSRRCAENQRLYRPPPIARHRTMVRFEMPSEPLLAMKCQAAHRPRFRTRRCASRTRRCASTRGDAPRIGDFIR